jgi:hypothetical protein
VNEAASSIRVRIVSGSRPAVEDAVNAYLYEQPEDVRLVGVEYSYQGPEFNDRGNQVAEPTHGVLLVLQELTRVEAG